MRKTVCVFVLLAMINCCNPPIGATVRSIITIKSSLSQNKVIAYMMFNYPNLEMSDLKPENPYQCFISDGIGNFARKDEWSLFFKNNNLSNFNICVVADDVDLSNDWKIIKKDKLYLRLFSVNVDSLKRKNWLIELR